MNPGDGVSGITALILSEAVSATASGLREVLHERGISFTAR